MALHAKSSWVYLIPRDRLGRAVCRSRAFIHLTEIDVHVAIIAQQK